MTLVRLEPVAPQSQVKHSTTELQRSPQSISALPLYIGLIGSLILDDVLSILSREIRMQVRNKKNVYFNSRT